MSGRQRYARVLRAPHIAGLWGASLVARLPIGINGLAIVLAVREETGSFAAAGAAAGAHALAFGVTSPAQGRLIDRLGPRATVPWMVGFHAVAMLAFVALLGSAPTGVLIALAAIGGLGQPPWSSVLRAMWPRLLRDDEDLVTTAFALDAVLVETVFVVGPLLVALAIALATPQAALLGAVVLVTSGTALLMASPAVRSWESEAHTARGPFGALASRGLLTVVLATVPVGCAFGAFEISLPAFAEYHGDRGDAGWLIAIWAVGSAAGGLIYGGLTWRSTLSCRWLALSVLTAGAMTLPIVAWSPPAMVPFLLLAGAFIAPAIASGSQLMGALAPPGMTTEAYAWGPTALVGGVAAGSARGRQPRRGARVAGRRAPGRRLGAPRGVDRARAPPDPGPELGCPAAAGLGPLAELRRSAPVVAGVELPSQRAALQRTDPDVEGEADQGVELVLAEGHGHQVVDGGDVAPGIGDEEVVDLLVAQAPSELLRLAAVAPTVMHEVADADGAVAGGIFVKVVDLPFMVRDQCGTLCAQGLHARYSCSRSNPSRSAVPRVRLH